MVTLPSGSTQLNIVDVPGDFIIRLEVPKEVNAGLMIWRIKTANGFIPSHHNIESLDSRELSYQVFKLETEI
jgi:hypothetical protein